MTSGAGRAAAQACLAFLWRFIDPTAVVVPSKWRRSAPVGPEVKRMCLKHVLVGFAVLVAALVPSVGARGQGSATILSRRVLCKQPGRYIGWPSIAEAPNGDLIAVFSGDRSAHVSPDGKVQMVRSSDRGETWSDPTTIYDLPIDDRDSGILRTVRGTMLVSWFTGPPYGTPLQGHYVVRSSDDGYTWSAPVRTPVTTPHGPIQLRDGRLLYLGLEPHTSHTVPMDYNGPPAGSPHAVSIAESTDDGLTWRVISHFPVPADALMLSYDEPQVVELQGGRLLAMFRDNNAPQLLIQSESDDGGCTWSTPHRTAVHGYPPHLLQLSNGWLLVSYAKRWDPLGEYACLSRDGGQTWDVQQEIRLSGALNGDLGYPASLQLADGSIWTVYYQVDQPGENPCLMGTHWRIVADECLQAAEVTDGSLASTTALATAGGPALCGLPNGLADTWYAYTATCTGTAIVAACGLPEGARLAVYAGTCDAASEMVCSGTCSERVCGTGPCATFQATEGQTYLLRVAADASHGANFNLEIVCGPPVNDTCGRAIPVRRGTIRGTTLAASTDDSGAGCSGVDATGGVWYSYTAPQDGLLQLSTCGSALDTVVSIHDGCLGTRLACNDDCGGDPCGGSASCLTLTVQKGRSYPICLAGARGERGGFQLSLGDAVIALHEGSNDPSTEGWQRDDFTGIGGTVGPGVDIEAYWRTQGHAGGAQRYLYSLDPADASDPRGWTYTARVKVNTAAQVFDASFGVIDRNDWWNLHLVAGGTSDTTGVWVVDSNAHPSERLSAINPSVVYHTYQIVFDPAAQGGAGGVTYYVDGRIIGTRFRGQQYQVGGMTRLDFGDIDRGDTASDSQWSLVRFEIGNAALCQRLFADMDSDHDVDLDDFGVFQRCYSGAEAGVRENCVCFDQDGNGSIDAQDFAVFASCFSGPMIPFEPTCD